MFVSMIAGLVVILVVMAYLATSDVVVKATDVKLTYEKVKFVYNIEEVLVSGVEDLCRSDSAYCTSRISGGEIQLTFADLSGYIPTNMLNENLIGGSFSEILVTDNFTTIRVTHNVDKDVHRRIYLNHYRGRAYGIAPQCVNGDKTTTPPCNDTKVSHDYPTTLDFRTALGVL